MKYYLLQSCFYNWNLIGFIIGEFYNINTVIFLCINVKLLWKYLYCIKRFIQKSDLFIIITVHLEVCEPLSQTFPSLQKKSREESEGEGSGVEILENRPYTDGPGGSGQYTHKVYHIGQHIPSWFRSILPKAALRVEEESWNAYPYTRTRWVCYLLIIKPSGSLSKVLR